MKKVILAFSLFMFCACISGAVSPEQAAQDKLNYYLNSIAPQQLSAFGFSNTAEFSQVKIEPAFQMMSLSEDRLVQWTEKQAITDVCYQDSLHLFPLSLDNRYMCMLAVDYTGGEWKAVAIGYRELAQKLELIRHAHRQGNLNIIRVYPLKRYYFTDDDAATANCTRIRFGEMYKTEAAGQYKHLTSLKEAMREMQTELKQNRSGGMDEN